MNLKLDFYVCIHGVVVVRVHQQMKLHGKALLKSRSLISSKTNPEDVGFKHLYLDSSSTFKKSTNS